jgi:hydroxypyruvate reductase
MRAQARTIIDAAIAAVEPAAAIHRSLHCEGESLLVGGREYDLTGIDRLLVVGAGKAGVPMARATEEILGARVSGGHIVVPHGQGVELERIRVHESGHPIPDQAGVEAGKAILQTLAEADARTLVICLISGGGSALLVCPAAGVELEDLAATNAALIACGATINEMNTLRKHLSGVKGGQLAKVASPAPVVTLILSDVVGDPLDIIASGPTVPDPSSFADCMTIVDRYHLRERLPAAVMEILTAGAEGRRAETPKPGDELFAAVQNHLIANNDLAVRAAAKAAEDLGYRACVLSTLMEGESREVAKVHVAIAREAQLSGRPVEAPTCLISGGETTVTVRGAGKGGRNQEFALAAALSLRGSEGILACSIGTDGIDGPTDAAGAMADGKTVERGAAVGLSAERHLADNDAYPFFAAIDDLVITGPTDTNVMDLRFLLVQSWRVDQGEPGSHS